MSTTERLDAHGQAQALAAAHAASQTAAAAAAAAAAAEKCAHVAEARAHALAAQAQAEADAVGHEGEEEEEVVAGAEDFVTAGAPPTPPPTPPPMPPPLPPLPPVEERAVGGEGAGDGVGEEKACVGSEAAEVPRVVPEGDVGEKSEGDEGGKVDGGERGALDVGEDALGANDGTLPAGEGVVLDAHDGAQAPLEAHDGAQAPLEASPVADDAVALSLADGGGHGMVLEPPLSVGVEGTEVVEGEVDGKSGEAAAEATDVSAAPGDLGNGTMNGSVGSKRPREEDAGGAAGGKTDEGAVGAGGNPAKAPRIEDQVSPIVDVASANNADRMNVEAVEEADQGSSSGGGGGEDGVGRSAEDCALEEANALLARVSSFEASVSNKPFSKGGDQEQAMRLVLKTDGEVQSGACVAPADGGGQEVPAVAESKTQGSAPAGVEPQKPLRMGGLGLFLRSAPVGATTSGDAAPPSSGPPKVKKRVSWVPDDQMVEVHEIYTRADLIRNWDPESEITLPFAPNTLANFRNADAFAKSRNGGSEARVAGGTGLRSAPVVNDFEEARKREHENEQQLAKEAKQRRHAELDDMKPFRVWSSPVIIILPSECRQPVLEGEEGGEGDGGEEKDKEAMLAKMDVATRRLDAAVPWLSPDAVAQPIDRDTPVEPEEGVEYETDIATVQIPLCDAVEDADTGSSTGQGWGQGEFGAQEDWQSAQNSSPPQRFIGSTVEGGGGTQQRISPLIHHPPPPPGIAAAVQAVASSFHNSFLSAPSAVPSAPSPLMQEFMASMQKGNGQGPSPFPPGMTPPSGMPPNMPPGMPPFPPPGMFPNGMPMGMLPPGMPAPSGIPGMLGMPPGMPPGMMPPPPPHMMMNGNSIPSQQQMDNQSGQQQQQYQQQQQQPGRSRKKGEQPVCRYFKTPKGCSNGARCQFRHC